MHTRTLEGAASLVTPTRKRYFIMVLLFITVVINYLDRSNLSIAAPALTSELGIDPVHVGLIFSAFGWTYAAMQLPGGWLVDRVPPRILYTAALLLWSLATIMLGFAASFIALFVLRMAVGALEAPAYPINSRVVTTWFPERERATAIGFLHLRAVCRAGFSHPCTGLAAGHLRLAHGVRQHRRSGGDLGGHLVHGVSRTA
jgi:ACS family D-galactonate transporter-like MFS transporter